MRHLPMKLGAAFLTVCLFAGFGQADAMSAPSLDSSTITGSPVEKAGYYGHRYGGYHPYHYHHYYRPYSYGYYGYGYRPYHRYGYNWRY